MGQDNTFFSAQKTRQLLMYAGVIIAGIFIFAANARAQAVVIGEDTTWDSSEVRVVDNDYGGVMISVGATLTIEPGTIVKLGSISAFGVEGALVIQGSPLHPVIITSLKDDTA